MEVLNSEEPTPETQPSKRRKKKSIVWEHFTIETVSPGCRRACCMQCKQSFAYSTGSKVAGTSHLKRHIAKGTCPALLRGQDQNQFSSYTQIYPAASIHQSVIQQKNVKAIKYWHLIYLDRKRWDSLAGLEKQKLSYRLIVRAWC